MINVMGQENYTLGDLIEFLNNGKIDPLLWIAHFPDTLDTKVPDCGDCLEFRTKICPGGKNPIDCFLAR